MADIQPTPGQTLALLLGASVYRYAPRLAHGPAFYNSSQQFGEYLTTTMGVPEENIASFFDESRSAGDQLRDIRNFLEQRIAELKNRGIPAHDLIVHYVGHGLFCGGDSDYCLAIRATDEQNEGFTSIRMRDLATVIRNSAMFLRKYLILDCCFSGAAYAQFQSGPLSVVQVKVRDLLGDESPQRGTSLLCSASAKDPSVAPKGLPRTMFSDSLLTVLTEGHEAFGSRLSFSELGDLMRLRIKEAYRELGVRPEVHSPDQGSGDVARVPLFPNPAWAGDGVGLTTLSEAARRDAEVKAEAEQKAREEAARRDAEAKAEAEQKAREEAARRPSNEIGPDPISVRQGLSSSSRPSFEEDAGESRLMNQSSTVREESNTGGELFVGLFPEKEAKAGAFNRRKIAVWAGVGGVILALTLIVVFYVMHGATPSPTDTTASSLPKLPRPIVDLAAAETAVPMPDADKEDATVITITRDGSLFLGVDKVDISQIAGVSLTTTIDKIVYVRADERTQYRVVKDVLDVLRKAGAKEAGLLTFSKGPVRSIGLEVSLVSDPKALTRNMGIPGRAVVVQVLYRPSESPEYKINNTDVQRADLQAKLTAIYANLAERVVFVKGDDQVEFRYIADVIDIGRASDIDRIGLLTSGAVASE